jgi:hypothetical protein
VIPLALAERLGFGPDVLELLRGRKSPRVLKAEAKQREAARAAAVYAAMPKLRPDAPLPARGVPEGPRVGGLGVSPPTSRDKRSPSRLKGETPLPCGDRPRAKGPQPHRCESEGGTVVQRISYLTLFIEPRHVRADLRAMRTALRTQGIRNADEVIRALERALDLIPLAPSPEGLRRRLRGLARVLIAMEEAGGDLEPRRPTPPGS